MKNKLIGSRLPYCNSKKRNYSKSQMINGEFIVEGNNLIFNAKVLQLIKIKSQNLVIPLDQIEKVETMTLNGIMPFGVCVFMKDGSEHMLGHMNNKKLADFIKQASSGMISPITEEDKKKNKRKKILISVIIVPIILFIMLVGYYMLKDIRYENIIDKELETINNMDYKENIDMTIKSDGDYAKVEKIIKEYYSELFKYKRVYADKNAVTTFNNFSTDYLNENRNNLDKLLIDVNNNAKEVENSLTSIINMLDEKNIMDRIENQNLEEYYIEFYKERMVLEKDSEYAEEWQKLINTNNQKTEYLKQLIGVLKDKNNSWYVEDGTIYMSGSYTDKYNELYEKIYENEEEN